MRYGKFLTVLMLLILIFSCASTPEQEAVPPGWFLNPPSDNDEFKYFTISRQAAAQEDLESLAGLELYSRILSSLGVSRTESQREDLSDLKAEISSIAAGTQVDGFKLIEKQIDDIGTDKIIYILVEMELRKLEEIREKLDEILVAGDTSSIFAVEAEEYISRGEVYKGTLSYIQAAIESADSDNRFVVEQNMTAAIEQLEMMSMEKVDAPESISVGKNGIFSAQMKTSAEVDAAQWKDVSVKVSFRDRKKGAVIGDRYAMLRTDESGVVTFVHPSPGFTGSGKVEISLDIFRDTGSLEILEQKYAEEYEKLKEAAEAVRSQFDFSIVSSAPTVPTGVFIVDSDFLRKPLDSDNTAQGLVASLKDAGFNIEQLSLDQASLFDLSDEQLLRDLPYMVEGETRRIVFGVAQITEFDDSATGFTVVTEAAIRVLELESGEILFDETLSKRVQGGESQATINTSFKELGKSFSALLIDKLP